MGNPTFFTDDAAVTARTTGTDGLPATSFADGMNFGASNAPGVGINIDGGDLGAERPEAWTLLDQDGDARDPQVSSVLGGYGYTAALTPGSFGSGGVSTKSVKPVQTGTPGDGSGNVTPVDEAWLESMAAGWTEGDPTP